MSDKIIHLDFLKKDKVIDSVNIPLKGNEMKIGFSDKSVETVSFDFDTVRSFTADGAIVMAFANAMLTLNRKLEELSRELAELKAQKD